MIPAVVSTSPLQILQKREKFLLSGVDVYTWTQKLVEAVMTPWQTLTSAPHKQHFINKQKLSFSPGNSLLHHCPSPSLQDTGRERPVPGWICFFREGIPINAYFWAVTNAYSQHFGSKQCSLPTSPLLFGRWYRLSDPRGHIQLIMQKSMIAMPWIYNPSKNSASHQPNQEMKVATIRINLIILFLNIMKWA